ncbi:Cgr1 family protein [Metarhizium robertsii]|uniref:rRNA-processing protein n=3 Tax=Metarhizium TaxID=5529 RepID=E9F071_METRA|nr:Cgr1 [Metarhizium robertsii ARSEF 23]EFY98531.1 Cgr1 [Metarhizium robertsii ARSEF 23]EXV04330.1 Cgr1 family protein [Metarhizium robertsii]KID91216.1 Cgr1 [Metarhizium guizhouense ARSEF 977]
MSDDEAPTLVPAEGQERASKPLGMRKNGMLCFSAITCEAERLWTLTPARSGKQWHEQKKAFRPSKGLTTFEKRAKERAAMAQMKAKEKEMKEEKEAMRKEKMEKIREKRAKKEEKERYEKMAETMHRKRVERLKRKEKRNKLINS